MADISKITPPGSQTTYNLKDATAREQAAENKNNIVLLEKYGGGKNLLNNVATDGSSGTLSWTVASDKSVTLSGSTNAANTRITIGTFTPKSGVQYVLSGCPSDGSAETFRIYGINANDTRLPDYGNGYTFTGDGTEYTFYIYINNSGTNMNGKVFKPMICSTADWALSHDYQPYSLPNTKITPELIELVDSGAKNLWATPNGTVSGWRETFNGVLPKGDYVISFTNLTSTDTDADTCQIIGVKNGSVASNYAQCPRGNNVYTALSLTSDIDSIWIYSSNSSGSGDGDTATFTGCMICTKAAWDVSQKFVPYRPTYEDTVEQVAENENNISKLVYETVTINLSEITFNQSMSGTGIYYSANTIPLSTVQTIFGTVITSVNSLLPTDYLFLEQGTTGVYLFSSTDTFRAASAITFRVFGLSSPLT